MTSHYVPSRPSAGFLFVPRRDTTRQLTTRHASSDRLPDLQLSPHSNPAPQTRQHVPAAGLILASIPGQCKSLPTSTSTVYNRSLSAACQAVNLPPLLYPPSTTNPLPPSLLPPTLFSKSFPKLPKSLPIRSPQIHVVSKSKSTAAVLPTAPTLHPPPPEASAQGALPPAAPAAVLERDADRGVEVRAARRQARRGRGRRARRRRRVRRGDHDSPARHQAALAKAGRHE
jgi:hypothetical protein